MGHGASFVIAFGRDYDILTKTQGGGHSVLSPAYGLGVDRVVSLTVAS